MDRVTVGSIVSIQDDTRFGSVRDLVVDKIGNGPYLVISILLDQLSSYDQSRCLEIRSPNGKTMAIWSGWLKKDAFLEAVNSE